MSDTIIEKERQFYFPAFAVGGAILLCGIMLIAGCLNPKAARADEIKDEDAVLAIIGESESEGFHGMLSTACAIRNRGTLKGVYGLKSKRVKHKLYNERILKRAIDAWIVSEDPDNCTFINGATEFGSKEDHKKPGYLKGKQEVYWYKGQVFYAKV